MQNALFSKISLQLGKRKFWTQNEVEHSFQQRVVFFEEISCKTHLLERYAYHLEKGSFWHKLKWNCVFNSELYSLSRFDPKRIFKQDILIIWQKEVFNTKWSRTQLSKASCILWADLIQNGFLSKISLSFGKRKFSTQNDVKHSFQHRIVFFQQIWCKTHFLGRYP